nr:transposase [Streptomyces antimycoticus]
MWVVGTIVERLVPDELRELLQRVVPEVPSRPQGGGRRRHGDREVLAAIVFVATSGCTWQQLPSASFGRRRLHRRYERMADHLLAFTSIACTLICHHRLTE